MNLKNLHTLFLIYLCLAMQGAFGGNTLPLYYWREPKWTNFGDYLSVMIVQRIIGEPPTIYTRGFMQKRKFLALGSIFYFASEGDVIWGTGINGKTLHKQHYQFKNLDIRAVRGPLSRQFLIENFGLNVPEVYGDPALLMPYLFPELKRAENPVYDYIIIPHYKDIPYFPKEEWQQHVVYPTEPWQVVVEKILNSRFVIASSLHGIIVAEAFQIPARMLRVSEWEKLFKYHDYYLSTGRPDFQWSTSVQEALNMQGEPPAICDLKKLYDAFPFDCYPNAQYQPNLFDQ